MKKEPIQHQQYMQRALELAAQGVCNVSPNPVVGCVMVNNGVIIGEGWHRRYGGPHAEVHAVHSVADQELLRGATVYVTLEPCSHYGKTPPCANLLIEKEVGEVQVAMEDPNPLVKGDGIKKLREAGIKVEVGLCSNEAGWVNKRFLTSVRAGHPYIILKWAQTLDGFLARENYDSKWISNAFSRKLVHKWRTEEDAILVGKNTVAFDNPRLTARDWPGKNPLRVVLAPRHELKGNSHVLDGSVPTVIYTTGYERRNACPEYVPVSSSEYLQELLADLHQRNVRSVMVEGGSKTLEAFIQLNLWDEARVFYAPVSFGTGIKAPGISGRIFSKEDILGDTLIVYTKNYG